MMLIVMTFYLCPMVARLIMLIKQCVHLGTTIFSDISIKNVDNAVNDFYMRTNNLMADFSYAESTT